MAQVNDKELHFMGGVVVSFASAIILNIIDVYITIPLLPLFVVLITALAASVRELMGVKWDWKDWMYTMLGGLIGFAISFI